MTLVALRTSMAVLRHGAVVAMDALARAAGNVAAHTPEPSQWSPGPREPIGRRG